MLLTYIITVPYMFKLFIVFFIINSINALKFNNQGYYRGDFFNSRQVELANKIAAALGKLDHDLQLVSDWPDPAVKLGQVSGVALDASGSVLVFHRGPNVWDSNTFSDREVYQAIGEPPIAEPTILVFNETGELIDSWGQNLFYMPHGITVDHEGNVWVTDVALHQVFKFTADHREHPSLILGEKFVPGDDDKHFCKPSAVAILSTGDFFVSDGYCNTRIIKYAPDGTKILQWGREHGNTPYTFLVPHALALAEAKGLVFVADRERGRVASFRTDNGSFVASYSNWLIGLRIFSVAYAPVHGGRLYIVNGPGTDVPVRGYVIEVDSGKLIQTFAPENDFSNPHDVATSPDGTKVYVAELRPFKVYKFVSESSRNETSAMTPNVSVAVKPTAVVGK